MRTIIGAWVLASAAAGPAAAAMDNSVLTPIHAFIDGFNKGDTTSAFAAYAPGDVAIIDEFAPHHWNGPKAPQTWAADYSKNAAATGVTDGAVKYGAPTRREVAGTRAYVIVPTLYTWKEHGKPMAEEGQMTFALTGKAMAWKIAAWTWSGVTPHPAK